jgi:hypothetical protein
MRVLIVFAFVVAVILVLAGVLTYTLVPGLIESRLSTNLQERHGLQKKPEVEVSSDFPPELLWGRIDRLEVRMDELARQGIQLRDVRITVKDADVSVTSLLQGDVEREIRTASLVAKAPEKSISDYLRENELRLEGGKIDVRSQEVVYRSANAISGVSASVNLELKVAGPHTIEVIPKKAKVGGIKLPAFLTKKLASGGRTLKVSKLPLGAKLQSVKPSAKDALVVEAKKK